MLREVHASTVSLVSRQCNQVAKRQFKAQGVRCYTKEGDHVRLSLDGAKRDVDYSVSDTV